VLNRPRRRRLFEGTMRWLRDGLDSSLGAAMVRVRVRQGGDGGPGPPLGREVIGAAPYAEGVGTSAGSGVVLHRTQPFLQP
jgi:hypothetical protein